MNSGIKTAEILFQQILGMTPTRITLGHGSFITIDFGRDIIKEFKTRHGLESHTFGEWHLWVYMCAWRIDLGKKPLIGSDDDRETIEKVLSEIELKALSQVAILNDAFDVTFTFGEDIQFHLFSYSVQDDHEQWMFFTPGDHVFTAGPGVEWELNHEV